MSLGDMQGIELFTSLLVCMFLPAAPRIWAPFTTRQVFFFRWEVGGSAATCLCVASWRMSSGEYIYILRLLRREPIPGTSL